MKKIGLFIKEVDAEANKKADEFENWLHTRNTEVIRKQSTQPCLKCLNQCDSHAPSDLFCVFVLGGDGTFLSAVRWIGEQDIPIIGVKFGEVGFLAETTESDLFSVAEAILMNQFATTPRMRLQVIVSRDGEEIMREMVLNDVVITKGALARLAHIRTYIDDHYLTTYRADGLIISTPTGSTAYSLAAGGPVIHPAVAGIIMTPICPFTLTNRPLIVPESVCVKIQLAEKSSDIMATFDGQAGLEISENDIMVIRKDAHPTQMITVPNRDYFDVLKEKLRWSGGRV